MTLRKILALLLAMCMMLSLAACGNDPVPSTNPTTEPTTVPTTQPTELEPTEPDPAVVYADAVTLLNTVTDMKLHIKSTRTLDISGETYKDVSDATVLLAGYGTENLTANVSETVRIGTYETEYFEIFAADTLYVTMDEDYRFRGTLTAEEFTSRFAPVVMLDAALYSEIALDGNTILFGGATAGESWLVPEYAELAEARGVAKLDDNLALTGYTYTVTYHIGGAQITWDMDMTIDADQAVSVAAPGEEEYVELEYVDAPRLIEQAAGYLFSTYEGHSVTSTIANSMTCQAAGYIQNQNMTINSWGSSGLSYMADVEQSVYVMTVQGNDSYNRVEHFENGRYTMAENDSEPQEYSGVTATVFKQYCNEPMVSYIPSFEMITNATAEDLGSVYYLELSYTEEFANSINQNICESLFQSATFLDDLAESYRTEAMDVYFAIDKYTGLPTALGYYYEGYHTIDGSEYMLSQQTDQSFNLANQDVYETIADEAPPVEEPDQKATPLFYHVTGPEGQEMWLLGTIHVGDARTSYLPQEIYDAFDAADALAVEFNSEAFYEQVDKDEALSSQVSSSYFFADGSVTADHIKDQELYDYALKMMKASGNYNMNTKYMKAYLWSSSIDNFLLRQGHKINSTQGVDNQLIWRAENMGKTIMDVESGLFQIQMLTGFSDALQEMLLLESCSTDALEYSSSTEDLFEMWCTGDEAALIAYLNDENTDTEPTAEEQKLIDEYNNAMSDDRNADMLTVAVGYLESGDVVFFAVGLAHLLAEDGLVNTLRDAGYTVELVTYG